MLTTLRALPIVVFMILLSVHDARAQTDSRLAVGANVTARVASSSDAGGSGSIGFEWRVGHAKPGWGWQDSIFDWFNTEVQGPIGSGTVELGQLRVRPLMAGYGYTWVRGRAAITADLVGGYTFNSFKLDPRALDEYARRLGATGVEAEGTNALAVKPEVQVWYDLNRRFGLKVNGGYGIARPSVVIRSSLGEDVRPVRADSFLVTVGLVYSLF